MLGCGVIGGCGGIECTAAAPKLGSANEGCKKNVAQPRRAAPSECWPLLSGPACGQRAERHSRRGQYCILVFRHADASYGDPGWRRHAATPGPGSACNGGPGQRVARPQEYCSGGCGCAEGYRTRSLDASAGREWICARTQVALAGVGPGRPPPQPPVTCPRQAGLAGGSGGALAAAEWFRVQRWHIGTSDAGVTSGRGGLEGGKMSNKSATSRTAGNAWMG